MGFLDKLLGRTPAPPPAAAMLVQAIERLQAGILTNLTLHYKSPNASDPVLLAYCVLSYAMLVEPLGTEAKEYQNGHSALVRQKALELAEVTDIAEAMSYLYAAITINIVILSRNPFSKEMLALSDRASELSLYIPSTQDLCGSSDALQCIQAIATFADNYLRCAMGR